MKIHQRRLSGRKLGRVVTAGMLMSLLLSNAWGGATAGAQDAAAEQQPVSSDIQSSSGVNAQVAKDTGVAVNGDVDGSSINSNQTTVNTGSNTNLNVLAPNVLTPTQSNSAGGAASGGNAVLMLPRNPLPLGNAALGRSNFGLQFGLQNNPILGGLGGLNGKQSALGWFMQAGLTIPFGKIPDPFNTRQNNRLDNARQNNMVQERDVFGMLTPTATGKMQNNTDYNTRVQGKISGMGAYNLTTLPSSKLALPEDTDLETSGIQVKMPQPKLLALTPSEVYSKPLNVGDKIGVIEVGSEYPYLGHTRSGWIKVLLPNGKKGWTSTKFEYIKHDYTEIDSLALDPKLNSKEKTAIVFSLDKPGKEKHQKTIR